MTIAPTVGRVVHFTPAAGHLLAAVICAVHYIEPGDELQRSAPVLVGTNGGNGSHADALDEAHATPGVEKPQTSVPAPTARPSGLVTLLVFDSGQGRVTYVDAQFSAAPAGARESHLRWSWPVIVRTA